MGMHITNIGYPTGGIEKGVKFGKKGTAGNCELKGKSTANARRRLPGKLCGFYPSITLWMLLASSFSEGGVVKVLIGLSPPLKMNTRGMVLTA